MNKEDITSPHTLLQLNIDFAISKPLDLDLTEVQSQVACNFLGKQGIGSARENSKPGVRHRCSMLELPGREEAREGLFAEMRGNTQRHSVAEA